MRALQNLCKETLLILILLIATPHEATAKNQYDCVDIEKTISTLSLEVVSLEENWKEIKTSNGPIYLRVYPSSCSYTLMLFFKNIDQNIGLDFVNQQNLKHRFGFLTRQDDELVFENHILMPNENKFLFKVYFEMFRREANKISSSLKTLAHQKKQTSMKTNKQ